MKRHAKFFAVARAAALRGAGRIRVGCVITKGNRVIAVGINDMSKTHPLISRDTYKMIHAEVDAIIGGNRERLRGCVAYVYRERADGSMGLAKPCKDCSCIMSGYGIRSAYYSNPSEILGYGMEVY